MVANPTAAHTYSPPFLTIDNVPLPPPYSLSPVSFPHPFCSAASLMPTPPPQRKNTDVRPPPSTDCTPGPALGAPSCTQAGAYRTLLTHFSTRYPTLPELDLSAHPSVAVAMDLMAVNLADLPWLPRLMRPMGLLFKALEEAGLADDDDGQ